MIDTMKVRDTVPTAGIGDLRSAQVLALCDALDAARADNERLRTRTHEIAAEADKRHAPVVAELARRDREVAECAVLYAAIWADTSRVERAEILRLRLALEEGDKTRGRAVETVDTVREQNDLLRDALRAFVLDHDEGGTLTDDDVEQARALLATAPTLAERVAEPGFREGVSAARMVLDELTVAQDTLKAQTEALLRLAAGWERRGFGAGEAAELKALLSGGAVPEAAPAAPVVWDKHPDGEGQEIARIGMMVLNVWPAAGKWEWLLSSLHEGTCPTEAEAKAAAVAAARGAT